MFILHFRPLGTFLVFTKKWKKGHIMWVVGGFCGYGGSVWVMGELAVGQWIVGVTGFQKIYSLYSVGHHKVEK